jgi:outer membrane protein assembly factor BamB
LKSFATFAIGVALLGCSARAVLRPVPTPFPMTTLWTTPLGESIEGNLAANEGAVYVATRDGAIRALAPATGAILWKAEGPARRVISAGSGHLVARGLDGTVSSLNLDDGVTRWTAASGVKGDLAALVTDDLVVVAGEGLAAFDPASGRGLWSTAGSVATAPPTLVASCLALGEADGTLRCLDSKTGASRWAFATRSGLLAPPAADGAGRLYLGTTDRRVLSIDAANGPRRWRWNVGADVQSEPVVSGNKVLVAGFDAVLYAFDTGNGNLAWRAALPSRPLSAPLVGPGWVVVACLESEILGFDLASGRRIGGLKTTDAMRTPPLLLGDRLYVGLRDRSIQALSLPSGPGAPDEDREDRDLTSETR